MTTKTSGQLSLEDLFDIGDDATRADRVEQLDMFKSAMSDSLAEMDAGKTALSIDANGHKTMVSRGGAPAQGERAAMIIANLEKSLGADGLAAISGDIETLTGLARGELNKDWTLTNPVSDGLVPFNLEAPAKFLVPRYTPLRNTIPRERGQGTSLRYKRITSITNSAQPGGAATAMGFFDSTTQTETFGGPNNLTLNRPPKIAYTGDSQNRAYVEKGFSDQVLFKSQFAGLGFEDLRALSATSVLWAHLMGDEHSILKGRGTAAGSAGYLGSVSAPAITTATTSAGGTIPDDDYFVYVVAYSGQGQSAPSTVSAVTTAGGNDSVITVTVGTEPAGGIYYGVYVGTLTGITNTTLQRTFVGNTVTLTTYTTTGAAGVAADSSFSALAYDGFYAVFSDPVQSGYVSRANADWSTTSPGSELDTAFTTMWQNNGAAPEEIWMTGSLRASLGQLMRIGGASGAASGYRTTIVTGDGSATMGSAVTGIVNPAGGYVVDVRAHRFALPGAVLIRSLSLPFTDSEVSSPAKFSSVQEYMGLNWPVIQMSFDISTYWYGTLVFQAPAWGGIIMGLTNDNSGLD